MAQEILRTEDVVEVLDDRIHASTDHPNLSVLSYEIYNDILDKIELQICNPEQKAALATTLSHPSTLNPVVLKDDIETYYPIDDLGEFKDAVDLLIDLPPTGNTLHDMRPVLALNAIYRWDGGAWVEFINTGTIDHSQLTNFDADPNFQHLSLTLKTSLLQQMHSHANKAVLDAINSEGSGILISTEERSRLPTADEKDALVGTIGIPSGSNKYVTNVDPRLNTIKNPYITFGPLGSGTTYMGSDISDLELALADISADPYIQALEILPETYALNAGVNFQGFAWNSDEPLMFEALVYRETILEFAPQPAGSTAFYISAGTGQVHIRGMVIDISGTGILASLISRDDTVFEDCTFTTSDPFINGCNGVDITGDRCTLLRCYFTGNFNRGLEVTGVDCRLQECRFDLSTVVEGLTIDADGCQVTGCEFTNTIVTVTALTEDTLFNNNRFTNVTFIDGGVNTRWLGTVQHDFQQAYVGRTRTVGPINSYADFRGSTETVFLAALADPFTAQVEVLSGTYAFAAPVAIPVGYSLHASKPNAVTITGGNCFTLASKTRLSGFNMEFTGASGIQGIFPIGAEIQNCILTMSGPYIPANYSVSLTNAVDFSMSGCTILGTRGINLVNADGAKITHNLFSTTISLNTDATTTKLHYGDNVEEGSTCTLLGDKALVRGNHFMGALPTKTGLVDSLWIGNYPPEANNVDGSTTIVLSPLMEPITSTGAEVSSFLGTATIAFLETGTPTVVTPQTDIGARIDRTMGFTLSLFWTSAVFSGDVRWEVTTVFRDRTGLELGTPVVKEVTSPRTFFTLRQEEKADFVFANTEYGFLAGIDPSHVSIKIRRLGDDVLDTLPSIAYLTEAVLTLYRD